MPEEVKLLHTELALADVQEEAVGRQMLEQGAQMSCMLGAVLASNQDVVDVSEDKIQVLAYDIHQPL